MESSRELGLQGGEEAGTAAGVGGCGVGPRGCGAASGMGEA